MASPTRTVSGLPRMRYREVLLACLQGAPLAEVNKPFGMNGPPEDVWERLDIERIAVERVALVILNGPRY